jgi:nicotinate-nucleotide--dimethylbenzimidazole phosphoribosyltransferase
MTVIKEMLEKITDLDRAAMECAQKRLDSLTKPQGSLGRLEALATHIAGITGAENPCLRNKVIFTLASDHGVVKEGVSAYPQEVTAQMVYNFLSQGAAINVLAAHVGARVVVVDMGVCVDLLPQPALIVKKISYGTKNMAKEPAMTREEALRALRAGEEAFKEEYARGIDIIGTGEMGIGNTTAASAMTACFARTPVAHVTGKGTGLDEKGLAAKIKVIEKTLALHAPDHNDPIDVLAKVGGFEIGGLAGIMLAAASKKVPIVVDGFIAGAAALLAFHLEPKVKEYMIAAHRSYEKGHAAILTHLGLTPLLDLEMRLGEGTGAALGIAIAEAAVKILTRMATFESAHVTEKKND